MKHVVWGINGVIIGVSFVLVAGFLGVWAVGQRSGAVFDLNNVVVLITPPRQPIVPLLALAVVSALVVLFFIVGGRRLALRPRQALVAGFFLATVVSIVWAFVLASASRVGGDLPPGVIEGWRGWLKEGGTSSAVHVVTVLSVASLWLTVGPQQKTLTPGTGHDQVQHS